MSAGYDVMLVAGNLLSISLGLPDSWRDDVLNSLLFSQMYANSQVEKFDKPDKWYTAHANAMSQTKWRRTSYKSNYFQPDRDAIITLQNLIRENLLGRLDKNHGEQVESMIRRIQKLSDADGVQSVFRKHVITTAQPEVQSAVVSAVSTVALQISLIDSGPIAYSAFVSFSTSEAVEVDIFKQCFSGKDIVGEISVDFSQHELNKVDYEKNNVRKNILSSLPGTKDNLILFVP